MIILEGPYARWEPRGDPALSWRKRAMTVVATLLLTTAFVLVGTPDTTAAPVLRNDHTISFSDPPLPCKGEKPGTCP